jgi:hypothetical protein
MIEDKIMIDPCPYLPEPNTSINWRSMKSAEGVEFYMTALAYAQLLWKQNLPARAILAVDRALLMNLSGEEAELLIWPLPYRAMAWMVSNYDEAAFVGNPRVHFQHLATRVKGDRKDQRKWRAWASWYLARQARPDLPGDSNQNISEPSLEQIREGLETYGIAKEAETWKYVVQERSQL